MASATETWSSTPLQIVPVRSAKVPSRIPATIEPRASLVGYSTWMMQYGTIDTKMVKLPRWRRRPNSR